MKFLLTALSAITITLEAAAYQGTVFDDKNGNGIFDHGDKPLSGICVSDGLNVVKTGSKGEFSLQGHPGERFIFITTPSGYSTDNRHYIRITTETTRYDFALNAYDNGAGKDGSHSFIQVTDTEIFNTTGNEAWVEDIRKYASREKAAFIIHTGDICYEKGLKEHISLMNTANMGTPVFYCIGNHDLVAGKYGEELFESIYGPVYYSFDVAGTHYIVTPMRDGDRHPSYTEDNVIRWMKNDLALVSPGTPVYIFNHDLQIFGPDFIYRGKNEEINLNEHNLKAWIYGHWHINHKRKQGDVYTICTSTPDKGGIDHSTGAYRVIYVDANGNPSTKLRYPYLHKHVCIASPKGITAARTITVNTYSSQSIVRKVTYSIFHGNKAIIKNRPLKQLTDWSWSSVMDLKPQYAGKTLTIKVKSEFSTGDAAETEQTFIYHPASAPIATEHDWNNLLGNASHTNGTTSARIDSIPSLHWVTNIGANIYMTSPLIHDGKIYTASVDEDTEGLSAVYALDLKTGTPVWRFPTDASIKNTIAIDGNTVFAQDVLGTLYAINSTEGTLAWKTQLPINGLPALIEGLAADSGTVYASTGKALTALDARTGTILWRNSEWNQGEGTTTTLAVGDGVVVGSAQWSALYGNDAKTGKLLWKLSDHGLSDRGASAAIHNGLIYITSRQSLFIIEASTGRIVARKQLPVKVDVTSTPLLTDNAIIFGSSADGLIAIDNQTFEEKWTCPANDALIYTGPYTRPHSATIETSPILAGQTVYVTASDGYIYGIDKDNGHITWSYNCGAPIFSSVAASGNALIVTDFGGNIYAFGPEITP